MPFTSRNARAAAHGSWANTPDRDARTLPGREAARAKLEAEVEAKLRARDPHVTPADVAKAVKSAETARMFALSAKGVAAGQAKRAVAKKAAGDA